MKKSKLSQGRGLGVRLPSEGGAFGYDSKSPTGEMGQGIRNDLTSPDTVKLISSTTTPSILGFDCTGVARNLIVGRRYLCISASCVSEQEILNLVVRPRARTIPQVSV